MAKPHESHAHGKSDFSLGSTPKALAAIATVDSHRGKVGKVRESLEKNVGALVSELASGVREYLSTKGKSGMAPSSHPSSSEIIVSGEGISGWLFFADNSSRPSRLATTSGMRVEFSSRCVSPTVIDSASCSSIASFPVPISSPHLFTVELSPSHSVPSPLSKCISDFNSLASLSRATADVWSSLPADFHAYWGASLTDSLRIPLSKLPDSARKKFLSEFESALASRNVIIEAETDDSGNVLYFFDLPSFSTSFRVNSDGTQKIKSISGREKFLFWTTQKKYFEEGD